MVSIRSWDLSRMLFAAKNIPVMSGQHCPPLLHGISPARRPRRSENPGWTFVKLSQLPHIQAILFATISGCTISGRQHVRLRAAEEAAPIAADDLCS